jgi:hypothetical protein
MVPHSAVCDPHHEPLKYPPNQACRKNRVLLMLAIVSNTTHRRSSKARPPKIAGNSAARTAIGPMMTNVGMTAKRGEEVEYEVPYTGRSVLSTEY